MLMHFLKAVGLAGPKLEINSLGCRDCRPAFRRMITDIVKGKKRICARIAGGAWMTNPLRIFDCKVGRAGKSLSVPRRHWIAL